MTCEDCSGTGSCDACDGYGTYPSTEPTENGGPECDACSGNGLCTTCYDNDE